jgi:hypothetical protein
MTEIKLRPDVRAALEEFNLRTTGRGIDGSSITDPEIIDWLQKLTWPGGDLNDTILQLLQGLSSARPQ